MSDPSAIIRNTSEERAFAIKDILAPLLAVIIGTFMVLLDSTVVNVAVPTLVQYFDSPLHTIQWSIAAYTLALSAVIPLAGWLSDKFQPKRVFLISIGLFTIGSVLCAFAQTAEQLIAFRVIQGMGGGMVSPIGMAMVYRLAPPDKRGSIIGMFGIPLLLAPALGPVLSGWLIEFVSWQWIFLINLPIGMIGLFVGIKHLPSFSEKEAPSLDIVGMLLGPLGIALLLFIWSCLRHKQPLLELRAFRSADFTRGIIISWIMQAAMFGSVLLFPLLLQQIRGFTPLTTGLILLPQAVGSMIFMPLAGKLFDKVGARPPLVAGMTLMTAALFTMSFVRTDTPLLLIMIVLFFMGSGMGLSMMSLNTHVLNATPKHLVSRVTPLTSASQQVIASFAVAGFTGYLSSRMTSSLPSNSVGTNPMESHAASFSDTFFLAACIACVGLVLSLFLRKPKQITDESSFH
ncbi:MDR family MFS transporter [Paenibacillus sp. Dod16]|uniref:MDR family MFS transporter n=1 Tax=Paenibacillus sp. Dod16 TaxID=3416392 RepID=UPI003CF79C45